MSTPGETAAPSVVEQVKAEVTRVLQAWGFDKVTWPGGNQVDYAGIIGDGISRNLAEAGLLRPELVWLDPQPVVPRPEPRVFRAGDPEPDGVQAVLDRDGDVLIRDSGRCRWVIASGDPYGWFEMLDWGPLVEVILPKRVTE